VKRFQREIEGLRHSSQRLIEVRQTTRPVVDIVLELTNLLSNDSWLRHLQIGSGEVVIAGETREEDELLKRMERSPMFEQVRFLSPLKKIPGSLYTRFHLSAALQRDRL